MGHSAPTPHGKLFMWAVQALSLPAAEQKKLFPHFAEAPDELALDHEEAQEGFQTAGGSLNLTTGQLEAIAALDAELKEMSGPSNSRLWTSEALESAVEWSHVRALAKRVLAEMKWPAESPPKNRALYVGPPEEPD